MEQVFSVLSVDLTLWFLNALHSENRGLQTLIIAFLALFLYITHLLLHMFSSFK